MPSVTMQDGTTQEFGERTKVIKTSEVTEQGLLVRFGFNTGAIKTFLLERSSPLLDQAALHGLNQKFGDSFAGLDDTDDMLEAFDKVAETLQKGEWANRRVSDGLAGSSVLAKALVKHTGQPIEKVKAILSGMSAAEKVALRRDPAVAAVIAEIEAAKTKKASAVDTSALLGKFA